MVLRFLTLSSSWKDWEGRVINEQYPLERFLGSGEQSAAFFTENATIKLVATDAENVEAQLSRWERAARLSHPHLIRLFDGGVCRPESDGLLYVVMEYGEESLAGVLQERPLSVAETREMLGPVLEAMAYLHNEGLVHGHIKPGNIMAVGEQVKLASDGASAPLEGHSSADDVRDLAMTLAGPDAAGAPLCGTATGIAGNLWPAELRPWRAAAWTRIPPGVRPSPRLPQGSVGRRRRRGMKPSPSLLRTSGATCRRLRLPWSWPWARWSSGREFCESPVDPRQKSRRRW